MPNSVRAIPEGYHSISPSLTCKNAAGAIDFYKAVFGATEIMRMPGPGGVIMHAELRIGDSVFNRAVAAGSKVTMPVTNQFWGDRYGKFNDPFGHSWGVATHVEDVAPEEMMRRQAEWTASMAKAAGQS
jgi:PhnB protein